MVNNCSQLLIFIKALGTKINMQGILTISINTDKLKISLIRLIPDFTAFDWTLDNGLSKIKILNSLYS